MEHNTDNIIRKKIRQAEQMPASFQHAVVWNRINAGLQPQPKNMMRYYVAAASVVFVIALAGYFINEWQNKMIDRQLSVLEQGIDKYTHHALPAVVPPMICADDLLVNITKEVCRSFSQTKQIVNNAIKEENHEVAIETTLKTLPETNFVAEEVNLPVVTEGSNNNQVEPIIGVIIPQKETIHIARERRVKIRLFKSPDSPIEQINRDPTIIFARIN